MLIYENRALENRTFAGNSYDINTQSLKPTAMQVKGMMECVKIGKLDREGWTCCNLLF